MLDPFGVPILLIVRNEVQINPGNAWDVELTGRNFIVRRGPRDIALHIILDRGQFILYHAHFRVGKVDLKFFGDRLIIDGGPFSNGVIMQNFVCANQEYAYIRFGPRNPAHPVSAVLAMDV